MATRYDHAERVIHALSGNMAAQDPIVASWRRSAKLHSLTPEATKPPARLNAQELKQAQEQMGKLLHITSSSLDRLYRAVGNVGCCVLLANTSGIPLARRGAYADDNMFENWGLWTGTIWSEGSQGTNGIGTCIAEKRAVTIHKDQHFRSKNTDLSCIGAPIFDHKGALAAVIDVSSCRADLTAEFSQLICVAVLDAASRIETQNFREHYSKDRILVADPQSAPHYTNSQNQGATLLAIDSDELVIGASRRARRIYNLTDEAIKNGLPLSELIEQKVDEVHDYTLAEKRVIRQALARSRGNITKAAAAMGISRSTLHRKLKRLNLS